MLFLFPPQDDAHRGLEGASALGEVEAGEIGKFYGSPRLEVGEEGAAFFCSSDFLTPLTPELSWALRALCLCLSQDPEPSKEDLEVSSGALSPRKTKSTLGGVGDGLLVSNRNGDDGVWTQATGSGKEGGCLSPESEGPLASSNSSPTPGNKGLPGELGKGLVMEEHINRKVIFLCRKKQGFSR